MSENNSKQIVRTWITGKSSCTLVIPKEFAKEYGLDHPSHVVIEKITFEQSEIDAEDKYRFLTNWKSFQCNGFSIPGVKEKHDWCGMWNTKGCLHTEDHVQPEHDGKIFVRQYKRGCFRASCEECYRRWQGRQSNRAT